MQAGNYFQENLKTIFEEITDFSFQNELTTI